MSDRADRSDREDRDTFAHHAGPHERGGATEVVRYAPDDEISILELLSVLLKYRYSILISTVVVAVLAAAHLLLTFSPTYTSEASFIPQEVSQAGMSGLQAVAGRFGVDILSSGGGARSLQFYEDILDSREILGPILEDTFSVSIGDGGRDGPGGRGTILEILDVEIEDGALRREKGIEWLREAISAEAVPRTGLVRFSVATPSPDLSAAIARRLLERVNDFNLETRQTQAAAERQFIEERMAEVEEELQAAEGELRRFLEANRQFQNSPDLVFEHQRFQWQVNNRQQLYTSLAQSYEQARISEVRNTPVITVVEPPEEPVQRDPRGLKLRGLLGLALGAVIGIALAFGREFTRERPEDGSGAYRKLHAMWRDMVDDLRRVIPKT